MLTYDIAFMPFATIKENGSDDREDKPFATLQPLSVLESVTYDNVVEVEEFGVSLQETHPDLMERFAAVQRELAVALQDYARNRREKRQ